MKSFKSMLCMSHSSEEASLLQPQTNMPYNIIGIPSMRNDATKRSKRRFLLRRIAVIFCVQCLAVCLSVCGPPNDLPVQDTTDLRESTLRSSGHYPDFFYESGQDIYWEATSPFRLNTSNAMYLAGFAAVTGSLIAFDQQIDNGFKVLKSKYPFVNATSPVLTEFGGKYGIGVCVLFGGYSILGHNQKAQETSVLLAEAMIMSGVWARVGKLLFGRERPSAAYTYSHERGGHWYGPLPQFHKGGSVTQYDAFPSGHMATASAIATIFAEQYPDHQTVPIVAYTSASIIAITRMTEHTHWASDVFAGSVLGYICAQQVISYHRMYRSENQRSSRDDAIHTSWFLTYYNNSPAASVVITF
jgi:membrane-associated phospholipid phosphatase